MRLLPNSKFLLFGSNFFYYRRSKTVVIGFQKILSVKKSKRYTSQAETEAILLGTLRFDPDFNCACFTVSSLVLHIGQSEYNLEGLNVAHIKLRHIFLLNTVVKFTTKIVTIMVVNFTNMIVNLNFGDKTAKIYYLVVKNYYLVVK